MFALEQPIFPGHFIVRMIAGAAIVGVLWSVLLGLVFIASGATVPLETTPIYGLLIGGLFGLLHSGVVVFMTNGKIFTPSTITLSTLLSSLIFACVFTFYSFFNLPLAVVNWACFVVIVYFLTRHILKRGLRVSQ